MAEPRNPQKPYVTFIHQPKRFRGEHCACLCRSLVQTVEARRLTAYHESGHALVAMFTPGARPVHKATIVPRGHALGMVSMVPHQDEYSITKQQMVAGIDVCMGGRVAEELIFGADQVRRRQLRISGDRPKNPKS